MGRNSHIECEVIIQKRSRKPAEQDLKLQTNVIEVLNKVSPSEIKEAQKSDPIISQVMKYIKAGKKPKLSHIWKVKSKNVQKYLHQCDHLKFRKGVLHRICEVHGSKYHQLELPSIYRTQVLQLLHDEQGHQRMEHILALVREYFLWSMMCQDVTNCVMTYRRCKKVKGLYDPEVKQGSLIVKNPLDLLCLDLQHWTLVGMEKRMSWLWWMSFPILQWL